MAWLIALVIFFAGFSSTRAAEVPKGSFEIELRLVPFNQPETTVDKLERRKPIINPVSTPTGIEMRQVGVEVVCWARNVLLDDQPFFERYHEKKYIDRLPIAKAVVKPGEHKLWPGNHVFTVATNGALSTQDAELLVADGVVRIKAYPVTVRAYRANPDESDLPMSMRTAALPNLTLRDATDAATATGKDADKSRELLPVFEKFAPLTIWLPASADAQGYLLHPLGQTFHLGAAGIQTGAGGGTAVPGLNVKDSVIEVPVYGFPIEGEVGSKAIVPGVEQYGWSGHEAGARKLTTWYPRRQPYEFKVAEVGPAILVDGDLAKFPIKAFRVATGDRVKGAQRGLIAELTGRHWEPGQSVCAAVRVIDPWPIVEADRAARAATNAFNAAKTALGNLSGKLTQGTNAWKSATNSVAAKQKALEAAKAKDPDVATAELQKEIDAAAEKVTEALKTLEESRVQVPAVTDKLALTETALTNASAKVVEVAELNTAANWKPFARARREGESAWTALPTKPVANGVPGELEIPLPATLVNGAYQLELGMSPDDPEVLSLRTTVRISVAAKKPVGVGLFTLRGRDAFWRGESFWVAVGVLARAQGPAIGAPVEVDLVDAAGRRFPLLRHKLAAAVVERDTFVVRIPDALSLSLAPGRYRFEAKVGDHAAAPLAFDLVDPEPETHFTNLQNGKYNALGAAYQHVLRSGRGAEELAREIQALGYNGFSGMSYDQDRVHRQNADLEQLVRDRPELGPWESLYQPSGRDRFMTAALRHNLKFYEDLFTYNDTQVPREPHFLAASERYAALEIASLRHHPAYLGAAFYDEFYWTSIIGLPPPVIVAIDTAEEMAFREKYKDRGLTGARATRGIDRFLGRPAGQRNYEDLTTFLTWNEFQDQEWGDFSRRINAVAKDLTPRSANFVFHRQWGANGGNIAPNGTVQDVQGGLDVATCVMYKDGGYGPRPAYGAMMADILRVRDGQPVWTQIDAHHVSGRHGESQLRNTFFALSQKVEGISFFENGKDVDAFNHTDSSDTTRNITRGLTTPYGDFLLALERGYQQVAVYYSRQADHLSQRKQTTVSHSCEGIWVGCIRAGFPADFLYDHQLLAGKGMEYQVIFAPGFTIEQEIAPAVRAALQRLISAGKTIVVERSSKLDLEGVVRLDSELDEFNDKLGGAFPRGLDFEFRQVFDQSEEITRIVREFLAKKIPPAAQHNLLVGPDWQKRGAGQYLFLPNFADPGFSSLNRALHQAPAAPQLRFPRRPPVCYDVLEMRRVEAPSDGDWMTVTADMRAVPGKILAFLPAAIERVNLRAAARVTAGQDLNFAVSVAGADGAVLDAAFPLEIELRDAAGGTVQKIWRAAAPEFRGVYRVGANAPTGRWTLRVRELMSGCVAEAGIEISAGTVAQAALDTRQVWVNEPARVTKFLGGKTPVLIVLDNDQAWARPQAERLQKGFASRGREARIVGADEVIKLPGEWNMTRAEIDGMRLWRGDVVEPGLFVEAPMVLLGRRYESRLVEALIRRDVLPEPLTANFPGRARALVNVTLKAFSNYHDTLSILSQDEAGLVRGVDAVLGPEAAKVGEVFTTELKRAVADAKAELAAGAAKAKAPTTLADTMAWPDWVRMVDVDPATGRTVVGTAGYGDNLFCLGADGKLLWKQFLPEHNVYFAGWIDGGKKIVAATGRGWLCFILDAADGRVLRKFSTTGWPDYHYTEGPTDTEVPIVINAALRQVLVFGRTGILAVDFNGQRMWLRDRAEAIATYPVEAEQSLAAEFSRSVVLANAAVSPDGAKLVHGEFQIVGSTPGRVPGTVDTLWAFRPLILDAKTGSVLAEGKDDPGSSAASHGWSVSWPKGSAVPFVHTQGLAIPLKADAGFGPPGELPGRTLNDGSVLVLEHGRAVRRDAKGRPLWSVAAAATVLPELDVVSADEQRLYRCDREGNITCDALVDGKRLWAQKLPFGAVLHAAGEQLVCGDKSGRVARVDAAGKILWQVQLAKLHELPAGNYPAHVRAALLRDVDSTPDFFPVSDDQPGEYEKILRHGIEQLVNGGFENAEAWRAGAGQLEFAAPGFAGKQALALNAQQLVTQAVTRRVVPSATYLLEFQYRLEGAGARLTAGVELRDGAKPALTASEFKGRAGQWLFGRLAVKSGAQTKALEVGFEAVGGRVLVDAVSLRPVRFPSANLLADPELSAVEPTFVRDIRVQYDRIPQTLRSRLMNRSHVAGYKQGPANTATVYTQEAAFLHNGRLDDIGSVWAYQPDVMGFSVVMPKPAYVSHLVLYLNNARPDDGYATISILANNTKTKLPESVALVRGNKKRFLVVHFAKPVFTDSIKILPLHPAHHESLTEIEVYGPLGGPEMEGQVQVAEHDAWPMFMGGPAHAPAQLPADVTGDYEVFGSQRLDPAFHVGATVLHGVVTLADPGGQIRSLSLPAPDAAARDRRLGGGPTWPLQTITPTTTPARHLGRLLVGSADNRMHAVADNGTYLWGFPTGGRVYSSPVPEGDDVYFGSDDGRLYKVDVHSGTLLWEFATGGDVRGSPALAGGKVFFASGDGFFYAVDAVSGLAAWKMPVAPHTRGSAAVAGERVFVGDEQGVAHCFAVSDGRELWRKTVGGYLGACPLVTPDGVFFVSEQGDAACFGADGKVRWQRKLGAVISGQPIATETQVLVPTAEGLLVLVRADGRVDERFVAPGKPGKVLSVLAYQGKLLLVTGQATVNFRSPPRTYALFEGAASVWQMKGEPPAAPKGGGRPPAKTTPAPTKK